MRLFLSYARVDRQFVQNLAWRLGRYHDVWYDDRLHAGTDWWQTILEKLDWCDCFVYVLSPESLESKYCLDEYAEAKRLDKWIVPVRLQPNIKLPDDLARVQYADFATRIFEDALADLIGDLGVLERKLESKDAPKKTPPRPAPPPKALDEVTTFRDAVAARQANDHETALRLLNTLQREAPDFLPEQVAALIADSTRKLEAQARHKEYLRIYQQINLLAMDDLTLKDAWQMWRKLRTDYPEIDHDPDGLACKLSTPHASTRLPFEPEMVFIPAGPFLMGSPLSDRWRSSYEPVQFELNLDYDYAIGKYPVTVGQYRAFIDAGGYREQRYWTQAGWQWRNMEGKTQPIYWTEKQWTGDDNLPVTGVSWYEAYAYTRWLAEATGRNYRLPTEAEWEKAARGGLQIPDGKGGMKKNPNPDRIWPWGDEEPTAKLCNFNRNVGHTTPVGSYPDGASPYGVLDMAGNVWEWCLSKWARSFVYPEDNDPEGDSLRVVRGGSWAYGADDLRAANRTWGGPSVVSDGGFRCALSY